MKSHPQSELLQDFLVDLPTDEAGLVLHLTRCAACQVEVEAVLAPAEQQGWTFSPRPRSEVDYESVWQRIAAHHEELLESHRQEQAAVPADVSGFSAWSEIGETARAAGRLDEAEAAFSCAAGFVNEVVGPIERSGYLCSLARLRRDQSRLDEAAGLFGRAARLYEEAGCGREHAAVLLERAALALGSGELVNALADLEQVGRSGRFLTSDLACRLIEGLALTLLAMDQPAQALAAVEEGLRVFASGWPEGSSESLQIRGIEQRLRQLVPDH
jgi:tetratricopeptide (TPR) repeat protein